MVSFAEYVANMTKGMNFGIWSGVKQEELSKQIFEQHQKSLKHKEVLKSRQAEIKLILHEQPFT